MAEKQVKRRAFQLLSRFLGLEGTTNVQSIDVAPAQPVLDLERLASRSIDLAGAIGQRLGYFVVTDVLTTGGGGATAESTVTIDGLFNLELAQYRQSELDLWICDAWMTVQAANSANFNLAQMSALPYASGEEPRVLLFGSALGLAMVGGSQFPVLGASNLSPFLGYSALPMYLSTPNATVSLQAQDDATGTVTVEGHYLIFAAPRGGTPPGMA